MALTELLNLVHEVEILVHVGDHLRGDGAERVVQRGQAEKGLKGQELRVRGNCFEGPTSRLLISSTAAQKATNNLCYEV